MSEFSNGIHQLGKNLSFTSIRYIAIDGINRLPRCEQDKLYDELVRGTAVHIAAICLYHQSQYI